MKKVVTGEFEEGRPWMAILFTNGLCIINVHMGHYDKEKQLKMMDKMMLEINKNMMHIQKTEKTKNKLDLNNINCVKMLVNFNIDYRISAI